MRELKNGVLIGKGLKRYCYLDPNDDSKCIKVPINSSRENDIEEKYYKQLQKENISWDMLVKMYDKVDTDMGSGLVFDLVKDFNGETSKEASFYLSQKDKMSIINNPILKFKELKQYIEDNQIMVKDMGLTNVLYQRLSEDDGKFIIIDGVGNTESIPISNYIKYFKKKKIQKYWKRFEARMSKLNTDNELFFKFLNESNIKRNTKTK